MQTHKIITYQYDELSDEAKRVARDWYREGISDTFADFSGETITDEFARLLKIAGFTVKTREIKYRTAAGENKTRSEPAIYWSGFSSQGDGASFEATFDRDAIDPAWSTKIRDYVNTDEIPNIENMIRGLCETFAGFTCTIYSESRQYCHEMTMRAESDYPSDAQDEDVCKANETADDVLQIARGLARYLYRQLEREYDSQHEDETVAENIRANEYEFTANGKRYKY